MAMSKADQLKRYKSRLEHAIRWREEEGFDDLWRRMIDLYAGRQYPSGVTDEDRIVINVSFATVNVIEPAVAINHPKILVEARKEEDDSKAAIVQAVMNYWWKTYGYRQPFRAAVKDSLIVGHGWLKTGWRFEEKQKALSYGEQRDMHAQAVQEADQFAVDNPHLASDLPTDEEIAANLPETQSVIVEDRAFMERISPFNMMVDPEATCMDDCRWVAQRIVRPLADVKKDERYKVGARNKVKGDTQIRADWLDQEDRRKRDSDVDRVTVWEFYDIKARTLCVFADGFDEYLIDPTKMPYSFGQPFEYIPNYLAPEQFYGIGDLEQLECIQQELNKTRSQMMNHRKKYARKYLAHLSAFGPEAREAMESDEDGLVIDVIDDNVPLDQLVAPFPASPMDAQLYQYSDVITGDIDRVSGVNEMARGAVPETRRTATEANIIADAANSRAADKLARVEMTISNVARKIVQLAQQYMTGEQVARVIGADGSKLWVPFDHTDIEGEFDFDVEGGSTAPTNEQQKRQDALQLMQTMGPLIGQVIDPAKMAEHVLREGFGIKNPQKFLVPPPPPNQPPQIDPKILESIDYKDAPFDVQRQLEQLAGLKPSQMSPSDVLAAAGKADPQDQQQEPLKGDEHAIARVSDGSDGGAGVLPDDPNAPTDVPPDPQAAAAGPPPPPDGGVDMGGAPGAMAPQMDPQQLLMLQQQAAQGA